jgi:Domain of unknown function (DUF4288)
MTVDRPKPPKPLFEESVIVFKVTDDASRAIVKRRANQLGRKASHRYKNNYGETVRWTFRELLEIQEIMTNELKDGDEVFFRWWDNPSIRTLNVLRRTHREPWWK